MTRFKELRRIERAIEHRDTNDLRWAQASCQDRIRFTEVKRAQGDRRRLLKQITDALAEE